MPQSLENIEKINIEAEKNQYVYLYETDLLSDNQKIKYSNNVISFKFRDIHFF